MVKQVKPAFAFFFVLFSLGLLSCSHKQPATRQDRDKWNHASLNGSYETAGHKNAKWDDDAETALTYYAKTKTASDDEMEALSDLVGDAADNAIAAGCDDPMIRYLDARFSSRAKAKTLAERQALYRTAANELEASPYPPIHKFYANVDAADLLWTRTTNFWNEVWNFRNTAVNDLTQAVQDKSLPEAEAFHAAGALFDLLAHSPEQLTNAYNQIEAAMAGQGIKSAAAEFITANFYEKYAWIARGHATADKVSEERWRLFHERLGLAEKAMDKAWSRDPYDPEIPTLMISIILGQEKDRSEMEKWFARAMKLDPKNYEACRAKLHYLLPQWYGSRDEMLEFGRQCVANTNWGGQVPLILIDAHREFYRSLSSEDRAGYWVYPDVWPDLKAGYKRFAAANPEETHFRYPYAWYAFSCGQMNDFIEQIKIIRQNEHEVRYSYFGGKEAFDHAMALASSNPPPPAATPGR